MKFDFKINAGYASMSIEEKEGVRRVETIDAAIPVWRPDGRLKDCVEGLLSQAFPVRSITLILSVEDPQEEWVRQTEELLKLPGVRIERIQKRMFNHGGTRAQWAEKSDADILLFMVQDAVPADRHLTEKLAKALQDRQAAVAYARHLPDGRCDAVEEYARYYTYPPAGRRKIWADVRQQGIFGCFASNVCAAYRRSWYERTGGFEKKILLSEDSVFAARAMQKGAAVIYQPEARVIHAHRFSFRTQWRRNFDIGVVHKSYEPLFGRLNPERAGAGLLTGTARYLLKRKQLLMFPKLFCLGCVRMLAYQAGKHYERLPGRLVKSWSLNKEYWR